jgi:hypothetical protein
MAFLTLGRWYADPCPANTARQVLNAVEQREQALRRRGRGSLALRLTAMLAHAALGDDVQAEYESLAALTSRRSTRAQALVELIYGQLLITRRRPGAMVHLERGFALAKHLFAPEDYFVVLKRHTLLALLPPADLPAETLANLLTTARVMARLGAHRKRAPHEPNDTFG